ncbi:MAG: Fe-S cluster assembly protein SufD [Flavisolibacter sp.]
MNTLETIRERYQQLQSHNGSSVLTTIEQNAFNTFNTLGIPTVRNEEWKYTRINSVFNKTYAFNPENYSSSYCSKDLDGIRLPGFETANELIFINGLYSKEYSTIRSADLQVISLEEATKGSQKDVVLQHLGHSSKYVNDGLNALNTAFAAEGVFISVRKGKQVEHPVYIYHITDARSANILSQPRILLYIDQGAQVMVAETYATLGMCASFTNQVTEVIVEKDAMVEYYRIQNDVAESNQVNTTHIRQIGKSLVNTVTVSLCGGIIRNNLNIAMEAEHSEAHFYGLYFPRGNTHIDNHTIVDNVKPHCLSNELYKGVMADEAMAVFNGKILVQKDAQKTNAYQSNKNILLSEAASVNTKPQLEIFADDVKCSHGCTVGQLDEEAMFYLRSRGVREDSARSLLVHAFALDILEKIKPEALRMHIDQLIFGSIQDI